MYFSPIRNLIAVCLVAFSLDGSAPAREVVDFDADWRFALDEQSGADVPGFDDSQWRVLSVPHDWAFEADYTKDAAQGDAGGYKPGGLGWYRKRFKLPADWQGKRVSIHFDGVYMNSEVWINGHVLGKRPYGYIPFHYDVTDHVRAGVNVVAVRVDSRLEPSARWYHGCGIYAHVKLMATDPVHIAKDGVVIRTPTVTDDSARVAVTTEVSNDSNQSVKTTLKTQVLDRDLLVVAESQSDVEIPARGSQAISQDFVVADPKLWSPESPTLYHVKSTLASGDKILTRFGVRTIRWEVESGFWLNGKNIKLLGVADHLEAGPVGAAFPDELIRWKIQLLKDMGCNAIRTAHNPQVPAFYELCDELGMLVMDEIFDGWNKKAKQDYGKQAFDQWWERDLRTWLKANRNHPSVVIWSLGNETHGKIASELVKVCHQLDPTRLVTSGHSSSEAMDVLGVNGASESQRYYTKPRPSKPFVATEAPHTWQVRGYYRTQSWFRDGPSGRQDPFPMPDLTDKEIFTYDWIAPEARKNRKQIFNSSYDNAMVRITARKNWELMRDLPWYSGHFRWTGFDYLGEAGYVHGGWPFRAFMGGTLDLAGFKKDLYYFYQSQWTTEPMAHILPHWTHPKMPAGREIPVWVYSNCDEVELFLNGESLGKDRPGTKWDEMQCEWIVPWMPGKLTAVGYKDGVEVTRAVQETAGAPAALRLSAEGERNPIITVEQVDTRGRLNPYAENRIHYHVDGPARILSLESGNPVNTENNVAQKSRTAFFGLARCFLEVTASQGDASLVAGAILGEKQQMTSHTVSIDVQSILLRGIAANDDVTIFYSIDAAEPQTEYTGAFEVGDDAVVNASVYRGDQLLFKMNERFGPKDGLYWGSADRMALSATKAGGDQAEDAQFQKARIATKGNGYNGKGYLDFGWNVGAFVEWYQENDGDAYEGEVAIRYSCKSSKGGGRSMKLLHNGKVIYPDLFFPNTKDWGSDWKTVKVNVEFVRGGNSLRLVTLKSGGPYIDELLVSTGLPAADGGVDSQAIKNRDTRMQWWREARFGMFVHWGLYSIPAGQWGDKQWKRGGVEWIQQRAGVPADIYEKELIPQFKPKADFAEQWARTAKIAGCRYLVFTSKHHEGFALHDSKLTTFDAKDASGRDLFKEIVESTRDEGLKVGVYHSLIDWHHPHAYAGFGLPTVEGATNEGRENSIYVDYLHGQVKEIMSGYGPIDIVWWDYSKEQCQGESWRAKELIAMVRKHQPQIVMNNRLYRSAEAGWPKQSDWSKGFSIDPQFGDFCTPEQKIPPSGVKGVDWETCMTMNTSWGYNQFDTNWKSTEKLIRNLVDVVSKGGNYLLNVGPEADGRIPKASIQRMEAIGRWMDTNGESIHGTDASSFGLPPWGRYTTKPGKIYAHVFQWPETGTISLAKNETQITRAYLLADKNQSDLKIEKAQDGWIVHLPKNAPDVIASVIAIEHN